MPVEQASVSTALPITESMEYFTRDRSLRKRDGRINTTAQRQKKVKRKRKPKKPQSLSRGKAEQKRL